MRVTVSREALMNSPISPWVNEQDTWNKRRDVVLPIAAVEQPDWAKRIFHARLTKEQVRDSPDVDSEKPVSRQQEIAMEEYWGKMAYWAYTQMKTGAPMPAGRKYPVRTKEDPDLRGAVNLIDYQVWATDGEVDGLNALRPAFPALPHFAA